MYPKQLKHNNIQVLVRDHKQKDRIISLLDQEDLIKSDYEFPNYIVVVDSFFLSRRADEFENLKNSYYHVVVIAAQAEKNKINEYYEKGVRYVLREDFERNEFLNIVNILLQEQDYGVERSILQNVFNGAKNAIVITDNMGIIKYINPYFEELSGYNRTELIGSLPVLIKSGIHTKEFYKELWDTINEGHVWSGVFINKRKNGSLFYEESTISPITNKKGEVIRFLKIGKTVEREKMLASELQDEVRLAKDIMISMFPSPYQDANLDFRAKIKAYNYLGGDFVSFQRFPDERYIISLIDVMGHGASSTIIGLKALTVFEDYCSTTGFKEAVDAVNKMVADFNDDESIISRYISGIFVEVDVKNNTFTYISAGHPDFIVVDPENEVEFLISNNLLLGVSANYDYRGTVMNLDQISSIIFYSDGLIDNNHLTYDEVTEVLRQKIKDSLKDKSRLLVSLLEDMTADQEIIDDIALCLININKQKKE